MLSTVSLHQSALTWVPSSCVYNPPSGAITDTPSPGTVLPRESCTDIAHSNIDNSPKSENDSEILQTRGER